MSAIQGVLDYLRTRRFRRFPADIVTGAAVLVGLVGLMAGLTAAAAPAGHGSPFTGRARHPTVTATTLTARRSAGEDPTGLVTLAATETAADGSHPAGFIQFGVGGTDVGTPVAVNSAGVATTTTTALSGAGEESMSAAFIPTSTAYLTSATSAATPTVSSAATSFVVPVSLTVPVGGDFAVTVIPGTVTLHHHKGQLATGMLQQITVTEARNYSPGWSVLGQESDFIGSGPAAGQTIPGTQLGWVPMGTTSAHATLGPAVEPGNPGLGTAGSVLALAGAGQGLGTDTLSADLILSIPPGTVAGPYTGSLTITYLETAPLAPSSGFALPPPQTR